MNGRFAVLDLFAGAGGLSLGFQQAGFRIEAAIEIDDWAATTFERNLSDSRVHRANVIELPDEFFKRFAGIEVVIGGPPCQGFSIAASNRRIVNDPRNFCYRHFLRAISLARPALALIENVKEFALMRNEHGRRIIDEVLDFLQNENYFVTYGLLDAKHFGVPQERIRLFLLASKYRKPELPSRTHGYPRGLLDEAESPTLWDSVSDLPLVMPRRHREDDTFDYAGEPHNEYQAELRAGSSKIHNHISMRHTDLTIERFARIPIGGDSLDLPEHLKPRSKEDRSRVSTKTYYQNHRRLDPSRPCTTITASFYSSFVHPFQHRNLTVREAARVQGFPDRFVFFGKKTRLSHRLLQKKGIFEDIHLDQFNQVGNAVPPILAKLLAQSLASTLAVDGR